MSWKLASMGMVALCGGVLLGCGSSSAPVATAPASSAASAPAAAPSLIGAWKGTMVVNEEASKVLPPEALANLKQMQMEMKFTDDGRLQLSGETNGKPYSDENRWEMLQQDVGSVTIKSVDPQGKEKPIVLVFDGPDAFHMPLKTEVAELGAMKFQRLR